MCSTWRRKRRKKDQTANEKKLKNLQQETVNAKVKQQRIIQTIATMQKEADREKQDFTLLSKSKAYRKSVAEKREVGSAS